MNNRVVGIIGAMPEEIQSVIGLLSNQQETEIGGRVYYTGLINNIKTVVVFSRWGKVAAATTVTTLLLKFEITELVFTGVAGGISPTLNIGDVVIGNRMFQHDMDGRPLMKQFEIPLLGVTYFESNQKLSDSVKKAVNIFLEKNYYESVFTKEELNRFGICTPKIIVGDIASGDKFFSSTADKQALLKLLPSILCVEMEGAAVAQVCFEYKIPFAIIRTISDVADESANLDFASFIKSVSSQYSKEIIKLLYQQF